MWLSSRHLLILLFSCFSCASFAQQDSTPRRLASMSLCTDQLLLLLAPREQIVSLSHLAADPLHSPLAGATRGLHLNHARAEELLPLQPDLVLGGQFSATLASNLLQRLGYPVLRLGFASSTADIAAQIMTVAEAIGAQPRGAALLTQMQDNMEQGRTHLLERTRGKSALFYSSNGMAAGTGTLQDEFIRSLGMSNAAAYLEGTAPLGVEQLLRLAPDLLFINPPVAEDALLAHAMLQHPALRALPGQLRLIELADSHFACASPHYAEAYEALARQLPAAEPSIDAGL